MLTHSVKGTQDLFGASAELYKHIEKTALELAKNFSCDPIQLPILEYTDLFKRSVGEYTDIVTKEMFTFKDRGDRSLSLRPEGTAQTVRFILENGLLRSSLKRYFYMGAMFRSERPQKGRLRQFYQIGLEIVDEEDFLSDVETILYGVKLLEKLGFKNYHLRLNSLGCKDCRPLYLKELQQFLEQRQNQFCETCQTRIHTNPLRVLDCKNESCQALLKEAPLFSDYYCKDCVDHFDGVKGGLKALNVAYELDFTLVRGLDYYTRTAFEILLPDLLGAQSAVCGGGRYDDLFSNFDPKVSVPCVGLAFGVERLMIAWENLQNPPENFSDKKKKFYLISFKEFYPQALKIASFLRDQSYEVLLDVNSKNFKKRFAKADKLGFTHVLVLGEEEFSANSLKVKSMDTSSEKNINLSSLEGILLCD